MSKSLDPLRITPQSLHRFWFNISTTQQWYAIMRELRHLHGRNWRGQPKVKRQLERMAMLIKYNPVFRSLGVSDSFTQDIDVWFDIPDPTTAVWIGLKYSIPVTDVDPIPNK